jgi:hypothetical protein
MSRFTFFIICIIVVLSSCKNPAKNVEEKPQAQNHVEEGLKVDEIKPQEKEKYLTLSEFSQSIIQILKNRDFKSLSAVIHPEKGVRISPYAYVDPGSDLTFKPDEFRELVSSSNTLTWGIFDGTGEKIEMNFEAYYNRFIYDVDFAKPEVLSENQSRAKGNSINNVKEIYPAGEYVEYYFSGFDEQFGGMDWRALRLVFEKLEDHYFLVGIIHDQWTT